MTIKTEITRTFDNNYVQVEVTPKNGDVHYYKLPANYADSFQKEYKETSKKHLWIDRLVTVVGVFGSVFLASLYTKKLENFTSKMIMEIGAGLLGGTCTAYICEVFNKKSHDNMLNKYSAKQIHYDDNNPAK